jgi:hypothetical protein
MPKQSAMAHMLVLNIHWSGGDNRPDDRRFLFYGNDDRFRACAHTVSHLDYGST